MGLFFYTQKGSIISMVVSPTTEIIEPFIVIIELGELLSAGYNKQIVDSNYFLNFLKR